MRRPAIGLAALAAILGGAFVAGYSSELSTANPNPIRLEHGVPVGVLDTPAGAVSAADNYLAAEDDALLTPGVLRQLVDTDWTSAGRGVELAHPLPNAALRTTPQELGDTHLAAAVAASRLESFSGQNARVGVWHEVTTWSSSVPPTQHWLLDRVTLVWENGRWLIASRASAPDATTPVPAWTNGGPADRTSEAFDSVLAGMRVPYYGALP